MPNSYVVTDAAEEDIFDIFSFIAESDATAAKTVVKKLYESFERLSHYPAMGRTRPDLTNKKVRFWVLRPRFLIVYRVESYRLTIVRILTTDQNIPKIGRQGWRR